MQDRFKFRVWDKENNKMFTPPRHFNYCIVNGTIVCVESFCKYDGFYQKRIIKEFDDAILMQCTGLKDKNGKLIYEGDILQSEEYPFKSEEDYNYAAEVLWDDASATFYYYTFRISNNVVGRSTGNTGELNEYENWKVIGNIYENPELLED